MKLTGRVIEVLGNYFVYVEHHHTHRRRPRILLVNGALSTTASFTTTCKYLRERYDVIAFDGPHIGKSRLRNHGNHVISKEEEANVLAELIDVYNPEFILSASWGGVSTLFALAQGAPSVRKAIVTSFSPIINPAMRAFLENELALLSTRDFGGAAQLVNETIGKTLPKIIKVFNKRYLSSLPNHSYKQIEFHIKQVLQITEHDYKEHISRIETPILFANGDNDIYTSAEDVESLRDILPHASFQRIHGAGHFLDIEGARAKELTAATIFSYLEGDGEQLRTKYPELSELDPFGNHTDGGDLLVSA